MIYSGCRRDSSCSSCSSSCSRFREHLRSFPISEMVLVAERIQKTHNRRNWKRRLGFFCSSRCCFRFLLLVLLLLQFGRRTSSSRDFMLQMEAMNVATNGVLQSAFGGRLRSTRLLPPPPLAAPPSSRFCCCSRLGGTIGGTRAQLLGSSWYGALIISQNHQQQRAIRHVVDSGSRKKLKEFTRLATATGGNGGGVAGGNDGRQGGGGGDDDDWSSSNSSGDGDDKLPQQSTGLLAWYLSMTESYPVETKALTAAILNFLGDLFCQLVIEKNGKLDVKRTAVITFLGLVLVGPTLHIWYLTLSKVVTAVGVKGTVIRLLLDQLVFSPVFIAVFFSSLLMLENRTSDIIPKLQQDWKPAVIANWKLWVPFQFINFLAVPQPLQVAFANVVALAWNIYLSFASHTKVYMDPQTSPIEIEMSAPGDQKD